MVDINAQKRKLPTVHPDSGELLGSDFSVMQADTVSMETLGVHKVRNSCVKPQVTLPHVAQCKGQL